MLKVQTKTQKGINKELNINMTNKTSLSILYEYASQVHKSNPRFEIVEKENPKDPFHAICYIADKISGKGTGNSKKMAKNAAGNSKSLKFSNQLILYFIILKPRLHLPF